MSLPTRHPTGFAALVRALGGEVYAGGRRALIPAPGHSAQDRSISLWLHNGRVVAHGFGGADWREALDDLRDRGWIDAAHRLLENGQPVTPAATEPDTMTRAERIAAARRLWAEAGALAEGSPAALYARRRGVDLALADAGALQAHAAAPAWAYRDAGPRRPALLAAVSDPAGQLTAVEITYLDAQGRRSTGAQPARKLVGVVPAGSAVRLAAPGAHMTVGEGVFTTLSAMRRFGRPGWALLSTGNLRRWEAPDGVDHVMVAGDRGSDGERSAAILCARLRRTRAADVALPPAGFGDWNDLDREG